MEEEKKEKNKKRDGEFKTYRILDIYERLHKGEVLTKEDMSEEYNVVYKTIQRDIDELRYFLEQDPKMERTIIVDKHKNKVKPVYKVTRRGGFKFGDKDIFALAKIVLESRAFSKKEITRILDILDSQCEDRELFRDTIRNEEFHYIQPNHNKDLIDFLWMINICVRNKRKAKVKYKRQDGKIKEYVLWPLGIMFSEIYFYLVCSTDGNNSIVFRVDRFEEYQIVEDGSKFPVKDRDRFEEGEFRKRIQFMYTGELMKIQFKFWGDSLEAVLDRLPTAKVIGYDEENKKTIIEAEVYGEGVKRWLLSQKEFLEVTRPQEYRDEMKKTIENMLKNYQ